MELVSVKPLTSHDLGVGPKELVKQYDTHVGSGRDPYVVIYSGWTRDGTILKVKLLRLLKMCLSNQHSVLKVLMNFPLQNVYYP